MRTIDFTSKRMFVLLAILLALFSYAFFFNGFQNTELLGAEQQGEAEVPESFDLVFKVDGEHVIAQISNNTKSPISLVFRVSAGESRAEGGGEAVAGEERDFALAFPQRKCSEELEISYDIYTEGELFVSDKQLRRRTLPEELLGSWNKGTFETVEDSINYHFAKHGSEVDASNIVDYAEKASSYRDQIRKDRDEQGAADFEKIYTVKKSGGKIPAHKYKHKADKRFAILVDEDFLILSFGR